MVRSWIIAFATIASAGAALAQPGDPIPPPRLVPAPAAMGQPLRGPIGYGFPVPGQMVVVPGNAFGNLPPRAQYGPSVPPSEYPYQHFVPGYPYPGHTMMNPYPRTVSSYSSGPSRRPIFGRVGR